MIEIEHSRQDDSVVIRVTGTVSRRDIDLAVPEIEQALELAEKPLKLMIRLEDFEGWEIGGLWEDMVFSLERRGEFGRIAVIGESTLEKMDSHAGRPLRGVRVTVLPAREGGRRARLAWYAFVTGDPSTARALFGARYDRRVLPFSVSARARRKQSRRKRLRDPSVNSQLYRLPLSRAAQNRATKVTAGSSAAARNMGRARHMRWMQGPQ